MVGQMFGTNSKYINEKYLQTRQDALHETVTIDSWGDIDIENYDLDNLNIGGGYTDREYYIRRPLIGEVEVDEGYDLRELDTR